MPTVPFVPDTFSSPILRMRGLEIDQMETGPFTRLPVYVQLRCCTVMAVILTVANGCGDARPAAERQQCQTQLRQLFDVLKNYAQIHDDVPRDSQGHVTLKPLSDGHQVPEYVLRCPRERQSHDRYYAVNPQLTKEGLSDKATIILVCDNHSDSQMALALTGDGSVEKVVLPAAERQRWIGHFLNGDEGSAKLPLKMDPRSSPKNVPRCIVLDE